MDRQHCAAAHAPSVARPARGAAQGEITGVQALLATLLVLGSGVASTTLWFFSRRYVGELAALPPAGPGGPARLRFSVLDFWGNRQARARLGVFKHTQAAHRCDA